ncbi:MAG: hypothetical protein V7K92_06300, partial [Nostoc sp.]|uniref:hypothetical protein n=1 Tax=Nostoc sp. TaxID=1180 RepID=UPI002FF2AB20
MLSRGAGFGVTADTIPLPAIARETITKIARGREYLDPILVLYQGYFILKSCLSVSKPKEQSRWACAIFLNIWS